MEQKEQMIIGCDVSKDKIDLCLLEKATGKIIISKSYANNYYQIKIIVWLS